ncbi:MAG: retron St85 family RNA-directed DNA polymerase [Pseudomonadota bacterium]|nr:retron St85 family RNA-directed DNA polymerase [Pseudomonadota bacterium]
MTELIRTLAFKTGMPEGRIRTIIRSAPERYKIFYVDKKSGRGKREIAQPARELKFIQRETLSIYAERLPLHDACIAYRAGLSIRDNALIHCGHSPIMKMDFKDFFPSITAQDWRQYFLEMQLGSDEELSLTTRIFFMRPKGGRLLRLAIGAPSSPTISNALLYKFDDLVSSKCKSEKIRYSRYADDLTFSAPRTGYLNSVEAIVRDTLREILYPKIAINPSKTNLVTTRYGRRVTGLTLANDGRVTIGRERKRLIRAMLHRFMTTEFSDSEEKYLAGLLAFAKSSEPDYYYSMLNKYGSFIRNITMRNR